jgi:anti-anti-sigma factor
MAYEVKLNHGMLTLNLKENVDLSETGQIKQEILENTQMDFTHLKIQGENLNYIDSSAVALFLFLKRLCEEKGALFEIASLSGIAQKVINLAGLSNILVSKESIRPQDKKTASKLDLNIDSLFNDE